MITCFFVLIFSDCWFYCHIKFCLPRPNHVIFVYFLRNQLSKWQQTKQQPICKTHVAFVYMRVRRKNCGNPAENSPIFCTLLQMRETWLVKILVLRSALAVNDTQTTTLELYPCVEVSEFFTINFHIVLGVYIYSLWHWSYINCMSFQLLMHELLFDFQCWFWQFRFHSLPKVRKRGVVT